MNNENKILIEEFLSEIQAIIESNYLLDDDGNIILKVPKNLIREQCKEKIDEYAKEIGESDEEVRAYLLKVINTILTEEGERRIFQKEHELVKQVLDVRDDESKKKTNIDKEEMER